MVSKTGKLDIHNLCNGVLVPKTDSHPESTTAYMCLEDGISGIDFFSTEDRTADEEDSFFLDSALTHDDISDDIALPPSSSSPPNLTSSPCSQGSSHSTISISSTPPARFSLSTGKYVILEDKSKRLDDLALQLNGPLENRLADLVGSAAECRWPPTLEIARDALLVQTISEEHEIFSRTGSPSASNDNARSDVGIVILTGVDPALLISQDFPQAPDSLQDLSPITFLPSYKLRKPSAIDAIPSGEQPFRIVKRAQSYVSSPTEDPASKRPKIHHPFHSSEARRMYARRTASARRADSLNSIGSPNRVKDEARKPNRQKTRLTKGLKTRVPIVAPPADHVTGMSISSETLAKLRLKRYLQRERDLRLAEPLFTNNALRGTALGSEDSESIIKESQGKWEIALGIGKERRLCAIDWIRSVLPSVPVPSAPSESESPHSTQSSSTSSSWTSETDEPTSVIHNLYEQLQSSFETRFHACWMFLRYFYVTMSQDTHLGSGVSPSRSVSLNSQASSCTEREGHDLLVWDIAVACLSLSVKLHRDFLDPLLPVYSREYLTLSPHRLTHDDLESAHRDVLSTFDYRLGSSPQLLMDEFWFALPSLRNLLDFEGGWEAAMQYAWSFLLDAIREPDVKAFSASLLTTVAIIDGITKALVQRACLQSSEADRLLPENFFLGDEQNDHVEGVFCDIQALVELTDVNF